MPARASLAGCNRTALVRPRALLKRQLCSCRAPRRGLEYPRVRSARAEHRSQRCQWPLSLKCSAPWELLFGDHHAGKRVALLDGVDDILTLGYLAEDGVLAVQPVGLDMSDEELAAVCAGSGIRHRK